VPGTSQRIDVFGQGGGKRTAEAMSVPFLGELPLDPDIRIGGDTGRPIMLRGEQDPQAAAVLAMAARLVKAVEEPGPAGPSISISE
jgi:ATP-binding protein involved in chromosome partitioning